MEEVLQKLIATPSVTGDHQANHEALEYITQFVRERGMHVERFSWDGFESLVATTKPHNKTPTVILAAHVDVVPAPEDSFVLREQDGKFYGRGTMDMKGAIAAYLQAIDELPNEIDTYDFGLMITSDEEISGEKGTKLLIEQGYHPKVCVLPDGGNQPWGIQTFSKGVMWLNFHTQGKSAHSSRPWEGSSAIATLLDVLQEIRTLFPPPLPNNSTLNIGVISGGEATNQIADRAEARADIRLASLEDEEQLLAGIQTVCDRHQATYTTEFYFPPVANDPNNRYLRAFADCAEQVLGYPPGETVAHGANDGRFFAEKGVPFISFYPPGGNHHGNDEWLEKQALYQMKDMFLRYLQRIAH